MNFTIFLGMCMLLLGSIIDIYVIHVARNLESKLEIERRLEYIYEQRQVEREYYSITREYIEKIEQTRKEFENQLMEIHKRMEQRGNGKNVGEMIEQTYIGMKNQPLKRYCENTIVNTVLLVKEELAEKKGIVMKIAAGLSENINIERLDLCSVFCNLLDNAIEACERITAEDREREVLVRVKQISGHLVIKVENSKEGRLKRQGEKIFTSKREKEAHGIGLSLLRRIADKYDGKLELTEEKNWITVMVILSCEIRL